VALDRFVEAEEVYAAGARRSASGQPGPSRCGISSEPTCSPGGAASTTRSPRPRPRPARRSPREYLHRLERRLGEGVTAAEEDIAWPNAVFLEADGSPAAALDVLASLYDRLPDRLLLLTMDPGRAPAMVRIALAAGDRRRAEAAAAAAVRLADLNPAVPSVAGAAAHAQGILRGDLAALRTAIDHFRGNPRRLARAAALEDSAELARRSGDRATAVTLLQQAHLEYTTAGAGRAVVRV
jgi:hypothetical protein